MVALKVDMSKAYNHMEWEFLENMTIRLGFHSEWIGKIMTCVSYQVVQKGEKLGPIKPS